MKEAYCYAIILSKVIFLHILVFCVYCRDQLHSSHDIRLQVRILAATCKNYCGTPIKDSLQRHCLGCSRWIIPGNTVKCDHIWKML